MKKKSIIVIVIILILGILGFGTYKGFRFAMDKYHYLRDKVTEIDKIVTENIKQYDFDYSWIKGHKYVAHAFGAKGTKTYTNSLEAFNYNYDLGHRVFEVDFDLTNDNKTICCHDEEWWRYITNNENSDVEYSYEVFKNTPLFTDYTPLDYMDIVNLLNEYPDIYIITDTKYSDELSVYKEFSQIVDYAKAVNPEVLDRIIPQIYTKEMLEYVMDVYNFKSIIFTLYQITWDAEDIAKFCIKSGIKFITVSEEIIEDDVIDLWNSVGINVALHTINDEERANEYFNKGVDLIYTDSILPVKEKMVGNNE